VGRLLVAVVIAAGIYGIALGIGTMLYVTDAIGTGATHNDCADFRKAIADERGIDEEDVEQREIKERTQTCLEEHELTAREAYRSEFLFWSIWPGVICAIIFLVWPAWARTLHHQDQAEAAERTGGHTRASPTA